MILTIILAQPGRMRPAEVIEEVKVYFQVCIILVKRVENMLEGGF